MSLSLALTTLALWVKAAPTRRALSRDDYLSTLDPNRAPAPPPARLRRTGRLRVTRRGGHEVVRYEPARRRAALELMYLPGGGLVNPLVAEHWWIVERLARATGAAVTVVNYPLAPEHRAAETAAFVDAEYARLAERVGSGRLIVAGDSAGGTVALGLSARAERSPDALVLFSPWVDLALDNPAIARRSRRDPSLRAPGLRAAARAWVGGGSRDDPEVDPARSDVSTLPPTLIFQGGNDIFFDDVAAFVRRARKAGAPVSLVAAAGGFHVYVGAHWTPEARAAYARVGDLAESLFRVMT
ncbi:esterase/lipase [Microbacterium testaceum StLB037]|uniref:Esterase/lipase n=1 Tax=Microbacterium testaceum (strain StLB037) TaxID=979556 RepID=E8N6H4_MICTS|nr:alpha/beta hydrolase fold domain-containing protein [Microbacterium testaceum]BAJ74122.1 esterase/lipase [Microbacterium testaceum StLB037]